MKFAYCWLFLISIEYKDDNSICFVLLDTFIRRISNKHCNERTARYLNIKSIRENNVCQSGGLNVPTTNGKIKNVKKYSTIDFITY